MLAVVGAAALVLVAGAPWMLPVASGEDNLRPPEDVAIYIIDDNYTLKWNHHRESMGNVTFSAEYQIEEGRIWLKVPKCQLITRTKCKFSLLDINVYSKTRFRVRAEEGNSTSSWNEADSFIPFYKAHISPPGVRLKAEDEAILVYISPPGEDGTMWRMEKRFFNYTIRIWGRSFPVREIKPTYFPKRISKLLPETTYCLEVRAVHTSLRRHSNYSTAQCINTTVANKIPVPENLEMDAQGDSYVLKWDHAFANMTFKAQWIPGYSKSSPGNHSDEWKPVPTCANVKTTHCVSPRETFHTGTFFLRVQASDGNNTSFWSEEKFIESQKYTLLPPPVIAVTPKRDSLLVYVSCKDSECNGLIYEVIFWENTSNTEKRQHPQSMIKEHPKFNIVNLRPLTVYCVQARVLSTGMWNKTSKFSDKLCKKTLPGNSSVTWIITGFGALLFSAMALYAGRSLQKYLYYVFFPPLKPPRSIDEFFSELPSKSLLLLTAEEHTERCFVIENTDVVAGEENRAPEEELRKYSSQSSQDSGNYSNEEEESVGPESGQDVLSTAPSGSPWSLPCPAGTLEDGACFPGKEKHLQSPVLRTQPALHG